MVGVYFRRLALTAARDLVMSAAVAFIGFLLLIAWFLSAGLVINLISNYPHP